MNNDSNTFGTIKTIVVKKDEKESIAKPYVEDGDLFFPVSLNSGIYYMKIDGDLIREVVNYKKPKTLLDNVAEWNREIEKRGYIN